MEVSWETITVKQFQLIYSVISSDRDDIDKQTAVLCLLLNTTPTIVEDMSVVDYNKLCQQTAFIFSKDIPGKPVQIIKTSGRRYAIEYNPKKYKQRQYVETQHFLKGDTIANLHLLMASNVREVKGRWIFQRVLENDSNNHEEVANDLLDAPFINVYHSCVFFCKLFKSYMLNFRDYLTRSLMKENPTAARLLNETMSTFIHTLDGYTTPKKSATLKG